MKSHRPAFTILFVLITVLFTYGISILDTSLYGVQGSPLEWLAFKPIEFNQLFTLSALASPFVHLSTQHLLMNLLLFVPVSMMIERAQGIKFLLALILFIHFQVYLLLIVCHYWINLSGFAFLGLSHIVLGLYGFWALYRKNIGLTVLALAIIIIGKWQGQDNLTLLAHILGYMIGVELFIARRSWDKFRS